MSTLLIKQVLERDLTQLIKVSVRKEHMATSKFSITTRTTNFLHIVLNRSWHIKMDHRLNITLIDTHTKCYGTAEYSDLVVDKLLLCEATLLVSLSSVVRSCSDAILVEVAGYMICCASLRRE